ncbi:MAG: hypothetical protein IJ168_10680 [Eubacterium sp.]|nr:hypothetical protein [Eubacterium sp.]
MNKSKNGFFTGAIILIALHIVFMLASSVPNIVYNATLGGMISISYIAGLSVGSLFPIIMDILLLIGIAGKKKRLMNIGLFIAAGITLLGGIVILIMYIIEDYFDLIYYLPNVLTTLAGAVMYAALSLLLLGIFKLLEEPDPNHPFAKKRAPKALPVVPYVQPQQPQAPINPYTQPQQPQAPVNPYTQPQQPQAPVNPYSQPQQPQAPVNPHSPTDPYSPL